MKKICFQLQTFEDAPAKPLRDPGLPRRRVSWDLGDYHDTRDPDQTTIRDENAFERNRIRMLAANLESEVLLRVVNLDLFTRILSL